MLVFDIYQKLRSEGNLIKDPFQLLPGSTRGTSSQSLSEKKIATDLYKYQQSKPSCLIATLWKKNLGKNRFICFGRRDKKKALRKTSRIQKKPPKFLPSRPWPGSWLTKEPQKLRSCVGFCRTIFCSKEKELRLFGNKILLPKRAIWVATLGPQNLGGSMFWEKKECDCQKSLRDF